MSKQKESADELISLLLGVIRSLHSHLNKKHYLDLLRVSPLKIQVLDYVKNHRNPLMKNVADFLSITPPSATSLINGMVREQFLARCFDSQDRRSVRLRITTGGEKILRRGFKQMTRHMKEIFSCLTVKERKQLTAIYRKIYKFNNK